MVSVLFCDLVGFTAASESADPEEVQARIAPYHARTRERIEAFGGTVEKFIGDAVMAVFGAPTAHEDDPERAVRAGLALLEAIEELNAADGSLGLSVRVGVNTGEAVVSLDARPELGEGMVAGDVVNTAARIQSQAPVDGVAVGRGHVPGDGAGVRVRAARPDRREGKVRAGRGLAGAAADGALRLGRDPVDDDAPRRARARLHAVARDIRQGGRGTVSAARHGRRRARRRQVAPRGGAVRVRRSAGRARHVAAGPLPAVRGRDHVLGAGRDREGPCGDLRVRPARGCDGEAGCGAA